MMDPLLLPANQPRARFYRGGERIAAFRGDPVPPPHTPEDWVGSTTCVRDAAPIGMSRLASGELLADAIAADPVAWLGERHLQRFGIDTMLLVKLLDAGQRLPVHAHPDAAFAASHLAAPHGKAEAWYLLTGGVVHLGLVRDVADSELLGLVNRQDSAGLLELMHPIAVEPGDTVYVPPGVLHAIGEGVLLAEVQEPEDLSILLEWEGFDLDGKRDGHLGLGFDVALSAVEHRGRSTIEIENLVRRRVSAGPTLPTESDRYFRLDLVETRRDFAAGFSIVILLAPARLTTTASSGREYARGSTVLVPHAAGTFRIDGPALVARPPRPDWSEGH